MGFLDGDLFGGMFDLNGDGNVDLGEEFMAYKMFEEVTKEDDDDADDSLFGDGNDDLFGDGEDF